jgi:hypothetical protein
LSDQLQFGGGGGGVKKRSEEKHLKMYCGREKKAGMKYPYNQSSSWAAICQEQLKEQNKLVLES